jgi:radical SAM protein with 4Fe4S-binding SPASM domain
MSQAIKQNLIFPRNISLGITSRCNFDCRHCYVKELTGLGPDMSTQEVFSIIDQIARMRLVGVAVFGGEPLMHPDFKKIIQYIRKRQLYFVLSTNATLIDKGMASWLKDQQIRIASVSLDGCSPDSMDALRGKGSFRQALRGIKALRSEDITLRLSVVVNRFNYLELRDIAYLGKELGSEVVSFNRIFFAGKAAEAKDLSLSPKEERLVIDQIGKLRQEFGDGFLDLSSKYLWESRLLADIDRYKVSQDRLFVPSCSAGRFKCAIRSDGWVTPCQNLWEVKCGSLKEKSLKDIWQNSEVMNSFRRPLVIDLNQIPECKNCKYQYLCFVGHRCYPYNYPGGIKNRSLYCWLRDEKE